MLDTAMLLTAAIFGAAATVGAAIIATRVTIRSQVRLVQKDNHLLYLWNRQLVDHIYRGEPPPPPEPPAGLFAKN